MLSEYNVTLFFEVSRESQQTQLRKRKQLFPFCVGDSESEISFYVGGTRGSPGKKFFFLNYRENNLWILIYVFRHADFKS